MAQIIMAVPDKEKKNRLLSTITQACGAFAVVEGGSAILGWLTGYLLLASFGSQVPMAPSTALLCVFYGSAIVLRTRSPLSHTMHRIAMSIGLTGAFAAALLFLLSYMGIYMSIEHLGIPISGTAGGIPLGHISPLTAFCFVLVGVSFSATLSSTPDSPGRAITAFWLACLIILAGFILVLAYFLGSPILYGGRFVPPALSTSLVLIALGISLLLFSGFQIKTTNTEVEEADQRALYILILIFVMLAAGIIAAGYVYYHRYEKQYRAKIEQELSAIAAMKVDELVDWREDRLGNAATFYKNTAFSTLVRRFFEDPQDREAIRHLRSWMERAQADSQYERVFLLDARGIVQMSVPATPEPVAPHLLQNASEVLRSGKVTFLDFHRDGPEQRIHLTILVPVFDSHEGSRAAGILVLRIDPWKYLYPFIMSWPTPSRTAETLLVRREENDALFLNELRFQKNTALNQRSPLKNIQMPAVKAALGQEGIVEGTDYRGIPVIADIRSVPNSPWFLVARMDISEVYTPLRDKLWEVAILIGALLICAGAGIGFAWRHQRARYYRVKYEAAEAVSAERRRTDEALRESEAQFRAMFDVASIGIAQADISTGQWLRVNQKMCEITGYSADEMIHMRVSEITHLEDRQRDWEEFQRVVRGESPYYRMEKRYIRKDGSIVWVNVNVTVIRDAEGQPLRTMAAIEDITERMQSAKALAESEERYRALIDNAHDIIQSVAQDGHFNFVNPAWLKIMGYTPDELQKITLFDILHPSCTPHCMEAFKKVMSGESLQNAEAVFVSKDGRSIDVQGNVSPRFIGGEIAGSQGIFRDITERKRAEEALRESEKRLREAQEMAHLGYWGWDVRTGEVEWSEEVFKIFRLDQKKFTPRIDSIQALSPWPEDHERDKELVRRATENHEMGVYEQRFLRPDGSVGYYHSTFQGKYDDKGNLIFIVGTVQDITERKLAAEEIRTLNAELEQRVIDRTAQLEAANKELEAFSYSVSHDLRAPIRHIGGFVELLMQNTARTLDEKSGRYLNIIAESTKHMGQLIDDILSFSRMGRTEMIKTPVNSGQMVKEAINQLQHEVAGRNIVWVIHPLPEIYGDPSMLKLVWINLIGNALKYTLKQEQPRIEIGYRDDKHDYIFSIKDNGAGFDMAYEHKLFNLFQRLHRVEDFEGTGVGLANVRRIIQRHGGRTWAEGKVHEGATFYFSLPKTKEGDIA